MVSTAVNQPSASTVSGGIADEIETGWSGVERGRVAAQSGKAQAEAESVAVRSLCSVPIMPVAQRAQINQAHTINAPIT